MTGRFMKLLLVTVAMTALTGIAHAREGAYIRGDLGYSTDGSFEIDNGDGTYDWGSGDFTGDWLGSIGGGYAFSNGFRLEGELAYRTNDIDNNAEMDQGGSAKLSSLMANGYYDFNHDGRWQFYLGAGLGAAHLTSRGVDADPLPAIGFDADSTVFAWQLMAGLGYAINDRLTFDIGYRYINAANVDVDSNEFDGEDFFTTSREGDYEQQAVTVGLRYNLSPPPEPPPPPPPPPPPVRPPPPPAPAACPASEFVVYFEWDRSNLNQEAQNTINAAAERARQCNITSALVVGHTDTSGSTQYNVGLSERRANVVRDALVAGGLNASLIQTQAHGETDLARATRDGVREPLNRRTAVTISFR